MEITVYSKTNCPLCDRVKNILATANVDYHEVKVDENPTIRNWLIQEGHRSVPQVYINGSCFTQKFENLPDTVKNMQ